jgi:hypothetical protein
MREQGSRNRKGVLAWLKRILGLNEPNILFGSKKIGWDDVAWFDSHYLGADYGQPASVESR